MPGKGLCRVDKPDWFYTLPGITDHPKQHTWTPDNLVEYTAAMTTLILPQINGKDSYTDIDVQASVISADTACRKASFFLAMNVGHLLRATNPRLLLDGDLLQWQLDVVLTSPQGETPKYIGYMFLTASDGFVLQADQLMETLTVQAHARSAG